MRHSIVLLGIAAAAFCSSAALADQHLGPRLAGIELGQRLSQTGEPKSATAAAPEDFAEQTSAAPERKERKVRVVYPFLAGR